MRNLTENAVADKSLAFALRVIALYKCLCAEKNEYVLSKQVLRSGTSIGANIAEAQCAVSRKETVYRFQGMFGNEVLVGAAVQVGLY